MTIDLEYIKWLASEAEKIIDKVAPLVAQILGVDVNKVKGFISFVKTAKDTVLQALELFINFPTVFGSDGEGLTDAAGCPCPDCPCSQEYASVVYALKAQVA